MAEQTHTNLASGKPETAPHMPTDWDKDRFPTSAKPVFRSVGLLLSVVFGLCYIVYYLSDHTPEEGITKETTPVSDFLAEGDEE